MNGQLPEEDTVTESAYPPVKALFSNLQGQSPQEMDEELSYKILQEIAQQQLGAAEASLMAESIAEDFASDVDIMARTIFGEARNQSDQGRAAVGWSVINRVQFAQARGGYWWGNTIREVCLKPWQYSCWNANDSNLIGSGDRSSASPIGSGCIVSEQNQK